MKIPANRAFLLLALLGLALLTTQCKNSRKAQKNKTSTQTAQTPTAPPIRLQQGLDLTTIRTSNTRIDTAWIANNTLHMHVRYSGGCKDHDFELVGNHFIMKSLPPKSKIKLLHNNNDDHCRELVKDTLHYDISPMQALASGAIIINVDKYPPPLTYEY